MVSHHLFYQLALLAIIWLFVMLHLTGVAYLRPAENDHGPLVSRLIDINRPGIRTRNGFSGPLHTQLACI